MECGVKLYVSMENTLSVLGEVIWGLQTCILTVK